MSADEGVCFGCGAAVAETPASGACPHCGELLLSGAAAKRTGIAAADLEPAASASPVPAEVTEAQAQEKNRFDQYVILGELGQGGAASVHRAWDVEQRRYVALKILKTAYKEQTARSLREAHAVTQLSHPNIVKIHKAGQHQGWRFIAMELIPGRTLDEAIGEPGLGSDLRAALSIFRTICDAIAHAHERGIVHRDLKPQNILVDPGGHPYVVDFGIARPTEPGWTVTMANEAIGTPAFMAPEQVLGGAPSALPPVDVYALGAILYYMLTGQPPFDGATPYETMERVTRDVAVPPRIRKPSLPRDLETVCLKAIEKDPAQRYGSVKELADDVGRWLAGEPVKALPISGVTRLWRRLMRQRTATVTAAVSLLVIVAVGAAAGSRLYTSSEQAKIQQEVFGLLEDARGSLAKAARYQYNSGATYDELARRVDEGRDSIEKALRLSPASVPAQQLLGEAWELKGCSAEAEACWTKALELDAAHAPAEFRLGRLRLIQSFTSSIWGNSAEKALKKAVGLRLAEEGSALLESSMRHRRSIEDPLERDLAAAMLSFGRNDSDAVLKTATAATQKYRGMQGVEEFHWLIGLVVPRSQALEAYDSAVALRPKHPLFRFTRGIERYKRGDYKGAREDYAVAIEFSPRFASAWLNHGLCREKLGDPEGAIADYTRAIGIDPAQSSALVDRGVLKRAKGDLPGALADLDAALKINPHDALAYRCRANVHRDAGRKREALDDYTRAIERDPNEAAALHGRGGIRQEQGDLDGAIADYSKSIEIEPGDGWVWNSRGTAKLAKGDRDGALGDYSEAIRLDPTYAKALYNRGNLRQAARDYAAAVSDYTAAIEADPKYAKAYSQRGFARRSLGDIEGAVKDFRKALETAPPDWPDRAKIEEAVRETAPRQVH